jgi:hypothetical protein
MSPGRVTKARPLTARGERQMTARCSRSPTPDYFVVMKDLGRLGREAIVDPEHTRSHVIAGIKSGQYGNFSFIHHVADGLVDDVTVELINEAEAELKVEALNKSERISYRHDHERALRVAS